ncbi:MAG TPA: radical SAM protein [Ruminococcus flavefaciens]|nr:radical SAM protein [Ruminococcus flavefaciens]HQL99996.1 radical SAM protein [Ruminococcus flavefaciens]
MNYNGNIYRPPIEANTLLIPVTEGCTHNKCTFCNMYQNVPFRMWALDEFENYVAEIKSHYCRLADSIDRVYLVGADPFALSAEKLLERISLIKKYLPNVTVITMYARTDNIAHKSDEDLKRLKEAGVNDLYIGVECGLNDVLSDLNKGYSADETKEQCLRLNAVGISHCDLLMLGTAGKGRGLEAAKATAALENEIKPTKILLNTMSAFEGTTLDKDIQDGRFVPATEKEILQEEYAFLQTLELPDTYFWAIHPLDSVGVEGVLKTDKDRMLNKLGRAIETVDNRAYNRVSRRGTL